MTDTTVAATDAFVLPTHEGDHNGDMHRGDSSNKPGPDSMHRTKNTSVDPGHLSPTGGGRKGHDHKGHDHNG